MQEIVLATRSKDKIREIKAILKDLNLKILSLSDFPSIPEILEEGKTFEENAIKKARISADLTHKLSLADDSGLEVDALGGKPGVYSSRFAGEKADDLKRNKKLLKLMEGVSPDKRTARYQCVIVIAKPQGVSNKSLTNGIKAPKGVKIFKGSCEGLIGNELRGSYGFGYDPLFIVPEYNCTMAELKPEIKNKISHRAKALEKAKEFLANWV